MISPCTFGGRDMVSDLGSRCSPTLALRETHSRLEVPTWGGAWGTVFWVDPVEDLVGIMMTQITSYSHISVRNDIGVTAIQAIVDSYSNRPYAIEGYPVR